MALSIALLIGTCTLAGVMSLDREGVRLGPPVGGDGRQVTIQLPIGFEHRGTGYYERWEMAQYAGPLGPGELGVLFVWERPVESGIKAETVAEAVMAMTATLVGIPPEDIRHISRSGEAAVGSEAGVEASAAADSTLVRAAVVGDLAVAVSLYVGGAAISEAAYERFDASCRTIVVGTP